MIYDILLTLNFTKYPSHNIFDTRLLDIPISGWSIKLLLLGLHIFKRITCVIPAIKY